MVSKLLFSPTTKLALDSFTDMYYNWTQHFYKNEHSKLRAGFEVYSSPGAAILKSCTYGAVARSVPVVLVSSSRLLQEYFSEKYLSGQSNCIYKPVPRDTFVLLELPMKDGFTFNFDAVPRGQFLEIHDKVDYEKFSADLDALLSEQKLFSVPKRFDSMKDLRWDYGPI